MLRLLGSEKRFCNGLSRRDLLHVGGLGLFGLGVSDLFGVQDLQASGETRGSRSSHFGQAKSCILLYLFGSPSSHETFDPKPDAPLEYRGEMKDIATNVPGLRICEGLPNMAKIMDRFTVVRSMAHPYPLHGVPYALTGEPSVDPTRETERSFRRWPFIGSVVDAIEEQRSGDVAPTVPRNIAMPYEIYKYAGYPTLAGAYGGFLGQQYDPVYTQFPEEGNKSVPHADGSKPDPFGSIASGQKIRLGESAKLPDSVPLDRFNLRRSLLSQLDGMRRWVDSSDGASLHDRFRERAYSLLSTGKVHEALDYTREDMKVRERYGMHLFGQSVLAARRLVEAGSKFVTAIWDSWGATTSGWDTHAQHYPRLKEVLLPGLDQTVPALITDLEERGMLDETLILCLSEHGRTPKIDGKPPGAGRHHWSNAYSVFFAGGGMAGGNLIGTTDATGGYVASHLVSPKDALASALYLLGIDPSTKIHDPSGQPRPLVGDGVVRHEFFS